MRAPAQPWRAAWLWAALVCAAIGCALPLPSRADGSHPLWQLRGKHNTVYLLGSIHVLRPTDYPLAPEVLRAYADSSRLVMEIDLSRVDTAALQAELLSSALLPDGKTLPDVLGEPRYARAATLAHDVGVELSTFAAFAPWFAAEAVSQLQLAQLGFEPQAGVEMYFLDRARTDAKHIEGLETVHDQIAMFQGLSMEQQAGYLLSSLEQAHDLPLEVNDMVRAWKRGDSGWFASRLAADTGDDPVIAAAVLGTRNRNWLPKIEALLRENVNYLVIVGTGHLVGHGSVIELLKRDGIDASQL